MKINRKDYFLRDSEKRLAITLRGERPIYISPYKKCDVTEVEIPVKWGDNSDLRFEKMGAFSYFCNDCDLQGVKEIGRFVSIGSDVNAGLPQHPYNGLIN